MCDKSRLRWCSKRGRPHRCRAQYATAIISLYQSIWSLIKSSRQAAREYNAAVSASRSVRAGSRTFHIFYVKRIWALLWDAPLRERWVNTWNYKSARTVLSSATRSTRKNALPMLRSMKIKILFKGRPTCAVLRRGRLAYNNNLDRMHCVCRYYLAFHYKYDLPVYCYDQECTINLPAHTYE